MKYLVKDCECEDWPACVHADNYAGVYAYEYTEPEPLKTCNDHQDLPESDCLDAGCPHYNECWGT